MIDIEDLVKHFAEAGKIAKYRRSQDDMMVTCPKTHWKMNEDSGRMEPHYERRPSLGIQLAEPHWFNCYSCGFKGQIESLVAEWSGENLYKAVQWLRRRYEFDESNFRILGGKELVRLPKWEQFFSKPLLLPTHPEAYFEPFKKVHRYTLDRGFTFDTAVKYEIGFDKRQRRIVMPVRVEGKIVGLYGRTVNPDDEVKYLVYNYSDEGEVVGFDRSWVLFRNQDFGSPIAVVVESGLDVVWGDQQGLCEHADVVALLGSKPSKYQIERLAEYAEVVDALDSDKPGRKGGEALQQGLLNRTKLTRMEYPEGKKDLGDCDSTEMLKSFQNRANPVLDKAMKLPKKIY